MSEESKNIVEEGVDSMEERRKQLLDGLITPSPVVEIAPSKHNVVRKTAVQKRNSGQKGVYLAGTRRKSVKRPVSKGVSVGKGAVKIWADEPTENHKSVTTSSDVKSLRQK